jgi:hypothetical protein
MLTYANKLLLSVAKNKENLTSKFLESLALIDGSYWVPTFNLPMEDLVKNSPSEMFTAQSLLLGSC